MISLLTLVACAPTPVEGWFVVLSGVVTGEDGERLFGAEVDVAAEDGTRVGTATTDPDGVWTLPVYGTQLTGNTLVALAHADGHAEGRATYEVNLVSPESRTLDAGPLQTWQTTSRRLAAIRLAVEASVGTASGRLFDATTGAPVEGVSLVLQQGWNAPVGEAAVDDIVTDASGGFRFEAPVPGQYTAYAAASGDWSGTRFPVFVTGSGAVAVGLVSPAVELDQVRAAIQWGESPFDLDLHLSGPLAGGAAGEDGTGQYHVWSGDEVHPERATDEDYVARMERTDADGRGPETVFVRSLPDHGELRLSVFDQENRSDADDVALAESGVVLQVWYAEDYPRYFTIAPGEIATLWHPVAIDVNTAVTYSVEQYSVGADPEDGGEF